MKNTTNLIIMKRKITMIKNRKKIQTPNLIFKMIAKKNLKLINIKADYKAYKIFFQL